MKGCTVKRELIEENVDKSVLDRPEPVIKPLSEISAPSWSKKKTYNNKPGHQDGKYGNYKGHGGGYNDRHGGNKWDKNKQQFPPKSEWQRAEENKLEK